MMITRALVTVVLSAAFVAAALVATAQQAARMNRVGVLSPGTPPVGPLDALEQGLRTLGYENGRNISIEWRFSETDEGLHDVAEDLVRLKVNVIVAINTPAALAAKRATATTPIVIVRVSDPVRTGLVASFARPGATSLD